MSTQWINVTNSDGDTFDAYLALPPTGEGPGLVLIQEIWGVNAHIRTLAEQYALDGFVVLAPDVFWRQERRVDLPYDKQGSEKAFSLVKATDAEKNGADMAATVAHLRNLEQVTGKVGVMGFCFGGQLAYRAAATGKPDAAVSYYGGGTHNHLGLATDVRQPILFHFGAEDPMIPTEAVDSIRQALAHNDQAQFHVYPGADHGFNCWGRPSYHQKAAALAHGRTLEFLATHLSLGA
ncbi:dienelactone hydrolase family protein [Marinobacter sp. M1N3S26]|uniref:dienelactone hydrolase family protein n=1 Tax=unclassified Marinobacter TaxID=83889 RepID=UPI00387B5131